MTGRHIGVVTCVQAVAPDFTWALYCIHREALAANSLEDVLDTTVKMVNFVKAKPLNARVFSMLCYDLGSDHVTRLQDTEVRWLSMGKGLTCFFF